MEEILREAEQNPHPAPAASPSNQEKPKDEK